MAIHQLGRLPSLAIPGPLGHPVRLLPGEGKGREEPTGIVGNRPSHRTHCGEYIPLGIAGRRFESIAKALNADGIPSQKSKRWGTTALHKVLTNEAYTNSA